MTNDASRIQRELSVRVIRDFIEGTLEENIDRIPIELRPKGGDFSRCCVYKDRAVLKYRLMAILGFRVEDEADETLRPSDYLKLPRPNHTGPVLSVCPVACERCVKSRYLVTNACRGCFARPCTFVCPRQAITVSEHQSTIDPKKCVDCGKCMQVCPYHAIIRVPIPCEEACPVGAITKAEDGSERIDEEKCISCGKCLKACPFSAVMECSQILDVLQAISSGKRVVAMVAPSIEGQFPGTLEQVAEGLRRSGFSSMMEVALGAELTAQNEALEFVERMEKGEPLMTSSCCPACVEAVKRHVPDLLPRVSSTPSPMRYAAQLAKERDPECVTVFIGPCVAKRKEAQNAPNVDFVMTFEELGAWFAAHEIDLAALEGTPFEREASAHARNFAHGCGVTAAVLDEAGTEGSKIDGKYIDGLTPKTMMLLKMYAKGKLPGNFLEMMACEGGCVGGPCVLAKPSGAAAKLMKK